MRHFCRMEQIALYDIRFDSGIFITIFSDGTFNTNCPDVTVVNVVMGNIMEKVEVMGPADTDIPKV